MDIATAHENTRIAACRIPSLQASLDLLASAASPPAQIDLYGGALPATPGDTPPGALLVSLPMSDAAGTVDEALYQIQLDVPIEAQITGADPTNGTDATWARIVDGQGDWWADASVSDEAGSGDIKLQTTLLYNGAYARITSAIFQG